MRMFYLLTLDFSFSPFTLLHLLPLFASLYSKPQFFVYKREIYFFFTSVVTTSVSDLR